MRSLGYLLFCLLLLPSFLQAEPMWPTSDKTMDNTRRGPAIGTVDPTIKWISPLSGYFVRNGPVIGEDGTLYVGMYNKDELARPDNGAFYAIDTTGKLKYSLYLDDSVQNSAAIDINGIVYVPTAKGHLLAVDHNGDILWDFPAGGAVYSAPQIGPDGSICIGSEDGFLYVVQTNGSLLWRFDTGGSVLAHPAIDDDGNIYIGSASGIFFALDNSGNELWRYETGGLLLSTASIIEDAGFQYVVFGSYDNYVYWLDKVDGSLIAAQDIGGPALTTPVPSIDGSVVYLGQRYKDAQNISRDRFTALHKDNGIVWSFPVQYSIHSAPLVDSTGSIFFGSGEGIFYSLTSHGDVKWLLDFGFAIESGPVMANDGTIYVISQFGELYAIGASPTQDVSLAIDIKPTNTSDTIDITIAVQNNTASTISGTVELSITDPLDNTSQNNLTVDTVPSFDVVKVSLEYHFSTSGIYTVEATFSGDNLTSNHPTKTTIGMPSYPQWPVSTGDIHHSGNTGKSGPSDPFLNWSIYLGSHTSTSPLIDCFGNIIVQTTNNTYYISPSGEILWHYKVGSYEDSAPVILSDGNIVISDWSNRRLLALSPIGELIWINNFNRKTTVPMTIDSIGNIYIGTLEGYVYGVNPDGHIFLEYSAGPADTGYIGCSPVIWGDDETHLIISYTDRSGGATSYLASLDLSSAPDPTLEWRLDFTGSMIVHPSIVHDSTGKPFVTAASLSSDDKDLYLIDPATGNIEHQEEDLPGKVAGSVSQLETGIIVFHSKVHAIVYNIDTFSIISDNLFLDGHFGQSSFVIDNNGTIFCGHLLENRFSTLGYENEKLSETWSFRTQNRMWSSRPAISDDGNVYVVDDDCILYSFGQQPEDYQDESSAVNLGNTINSEHSERDPAINRDGNMLLFTSNEDPVHILDSDYDIYISEKTGEESWELPERLDSKINFIKSTSGCESPEGGCTIMPMPTQLTPRLQEDKTLYYSAFSLLGSMNFYMIYKSEYNELDGSWDFPQQLNTLINCTSSEQMDPFVTDDNKLYFVSTNAAGGYGSTDIWVAEWQQTIDDWGVPENLGPSINSLAIERSPCLTAEGTTLYFSSNRMGGHGGMDIYKSEYSEGDWTSPVNLGKAVNTPYDDDMPFVTHNGAKLYFTSNRPGGLGGYDIYVYTFGATPNGDSCDQDSDCISGYCVDSVCCSEECDSPPTQCMMSVCPGGSCDYIPVAEGTSCEDRNNCTYDDKCNSSGDCIGTTYECIPGPCEASSECNGDGTCSSTPLPDGSQCDDSDECTEDDRCEDGICKGTEIEGCREQQDGGTDGGADGGDDNEGMAGGGCGCTLENNRGTKQDAFLLFISGLFLLFIGRRMRNSQHMVVQKEK